MRRFLRENGFSEEARLSGHLIPQGGNRRKVARGRVLLAGDAAGLASRPSGEGIHFALVSGREIGRKILDPGYDMKEFRALLSLKRRQESYSRLFESVPRLQ